MGCHVKIGVIIKLNPKYFWKYFGYLLTYLFQLSMTLEIKWPP